VLERGYLLYDEGLIHVFYDTRRQPKGYNTEDKGGWKVIYSNEQDLIRMRNPSKFPVFEPGDISFFKDISLPTPWNKDIEGVINDWKDQNKYEELVSNLFALDFQKTSHWMFGYPHELQGPGMELKIQLATNNYDIFYCDSIDREFIDQLKEDEWTLLLMLSPDYRPGWNWKDEARLYFWIKKDDLKNGNFEDVWLIVESRKKPFEKANYPQTYIKSVKQFKEEYYNILFKKIPLTKLQIRFFLNKLAGVEACQYNGLKWRCGGKDFEYSRKVLDQMKVSKEIQNLFFEKCKEYGGYCDCEILMNAAQMLLNEETPW